MFYIVCVFPWQAVIFMNMNVGRINADHRSRIPVGHKETKK